MSEVTTSNLIQGPATVYVGPFGEPEPASIAATPAGNWVDVGGTKEGLELAIADEYAELEVDQLIMTPERRRTKRTVTAQTTMAEATLDNLARAINETLPGAARFELTDGLDGFRPAYQAIIVDGLAPGGRRRRVILRKVLGTDSVATAYKKADQTVIPVTFTAHYVSSSIRAVAIEDEPEPTPPPPVP